MIRVLGRGLAVAMLALTLTGCAWWRVAGPSCRSLNGLYAHTLNATQTANLPDGYLRVPVAIHLMNNPADPAVEWPTAFWTPTMIEKYFGLGNLSVNQVWATAQVHFDLKLVQQCRYRPPPVAHHPEGAKGMIPPDFQALLSKTPNEQQQIINHYLLLNVVYGFPRTLNIYLWRAMHGVNGYGESPRRNRPEVEERGLEALSTVWYESHLICGPLEMVESDECQLGLAHEMGHAMGLRHSCYLCNCCADLCWVPRNYYYICAANDPAPQQWTNWCSCEGTPGDDTANAYTACRNELFECCPEESTSQRLMYPIVVEVPKGGKTLCPGEIQSARRSVKEFFY